MSFQHRGFWMPRGLQCLSNGEMNYVNSSQVEPKRSHPWFMDSPEQFVNKKQAIEDVNHRPTMGIPHMNVSSWNNSSGFQSVSGQFTDRLFGSEPVGTVTLADRNDPPSNSGNMNIVQKNLGEQYGNNSSFGLSVSHTIADPSSCLSFGGIRKVKVNEVRDSNSSMSIPTENSYGRANNGSMSMSCAYRKNGFSLGPTYGNGGENNTLMGLAFSKPGRNFISMGQTLNMGDSNFMSMGHNTGTENVLLLGQSFDKPHAKFISMGQPYDKGDSTVMSMPPSYNKGQENLVSMAPTYKAAENLFSIGPSYTREGDNVISVGPPYDKSDCNTTLMGRTKDNQDLNILSAGHNYGKGGTTTISFGGFHGEPGTNPSGGYDLLMGTQNLAQASEEPLLTGTQNPVQASEESGEKVLTQENVDPKVNSDPKANPKTNTKSKNKEPKTAKKAATNTFPSNVKSLLSTGMLDGVTVQYVSWSREKSLKAIIKGTGYQCSCRDCQLTKTLNAYEFERHANCKTKHPNNHIYFENGKTIYAVVQELKNTPQEMLYDALQKVTGSQINQKNFRIWKASYQAATRELQRIFGKEDGAKEVEDAPPLS